MPAPAKTPTYMTPAELRELNNAIVAAYLGDDKPSQLEVAQRLGVSAPTVRGALKSRGIKGRIGREQKVRSGE